MKESKWFLECEWKQDPELLFTVPNTSERCLRNKSLNEVCVRRMGNSRSLCLQSKVLGPEDASNKKEAGSGETR